MMVGEGLGVQPGYLAAFRVRDLPRDPRTGILAAPVPDIGSTTGLRQAGTGRELDAEGDRGVRGQQVHTCGNGTGQHDDDGGGSQGDHHLPT